MMRPLLILLVFIFIAVKGALGQECIDGIYYNIISEEAVEVTYWNSTVVTDGIIESDKRYRGAVVVPEKVTISGKDYSVTRLGKYSFMLSTVTKLTLPATVVEFGDNCFESTHNLSELTMGENSSFFSEGNVIYEKLTGGKYRLVYAAQGITGTLAVKEGTTDMGGLLNHAKLQKVVVPSTVSALNIGQFAGCSNLQEVQFADGCKIGSIPLRSFLSCFNLKALTNIPTTLTEISKESGLSDERVKLERITMSGEDGRYISIGGCVLYDKTAKTLVLTGSVSDDSVVIPAGLTDEVFGIVVGLMGNTSTLTIAEGYTEMDLSCLFPCEELTTLNLPSTITKVQTSVDIPETVASITFAEENKNYSSTDSDGYLYSRDGKTLCFVLPFASGNMVVKSGVTDILIGAFDCIYDQKSFSVETDNEKYSSKNGLLLSADGKMLILVPSRVKEIVIPESVSTVDYCAFFGNEVLKTIKCPILTPPTVNNDWIYTNAEATVYVPNGTKSDYDNSVWATSFSIVESEEIATNIHSTAQGYRGKVRLTLKKGRVVIEMKNGECKDLTGRIIEQ